MKPRRASTRRNQGRRDRFRAQDGMHLTETEAPAPFRGGATFTPPVENLMLPPALPAASRKVEEGTVGEADRAEQLVFRDEVNDRKRTDYLTHKFFPYPARFIPQIPRYFIREFMHNHHALLDPFCGCGTSLVEAKFLGYTSYGIEINPLGRLLTEVKTTPLDLGKLGIWRKSVSEMFRKNVADPFIPEFTNRDYWFNPEVQKDLGRLKVAIDHVRNEAVRKFFLVCLASIVRKCSNADPAISKPVYTKRMKKLVPDRKVDAFKLFNDRLTEYSGRIVTLSNFLEHDETEAKLIGEDARRIDLPDGSVHLVVTSPPFINAQEYFRTTKFEIWWCGLADAAMVHEMETRMIGMERVSNGEAKDLQLLKKRGMERADGFIEKVYAKDPGRAYIMFHYFREMEIVFREVKRVLDDEGRFCITIGDNTIRKIPVPTHALIVDLAESVGFKTQKVAYDIIKVHSLSIKRHETAGLIDKEWAMIFSKG